MKAQECTTTKCNQCGEFKPRSEYDQNRKTRKCKQCEAKASHQRYLRNRVKVLKRGAERRIAKADEIKASMARWYVENRERVLARQKAYNARPERKELERERQAARYAAKREAIQAARTAYYQTNPKARERLQRYQEAYYHQNKDQFVARVAKRRAAKHRAVPLWADTKAIAKIYQSAAELTKATGIQHHVDHIVPLQGRTVCGLHVEYNLQVIPAIENRRKFNRLKI